MKNGEAKREHVYFHEGMSKTRNITPHTLINYVNIQTIHSLESNRTFICT